MGIKPMGRNLPKPRLGSAEIGCCTECKLGIYSDQNYARVLRPTIGRNHTWCVPDGAEVLEWVTPS